LNSIESIISIVPTERSGLCHYVIRSVVYVKYRSLLDISVLLAIRSGFLQNTNQSLVYPLCISIVLKMVMCRLLIVDLEHVNYELYDFIEKVLTLIIDQDIWMINVVKDIFIEKMVVSLPSTFFSTLVFAYFIRYSMATMIYCFLCNEIGIKTPT